MLADLATSQSTRKASQPFFDSGIYAEHQQVIWVLYDHYLGLGAYMQIDAVMISSAGTVSSIRKV